MSFPQSNLSLGQSSTPTPPVTPENTSSSSSSSSQQTSTAPLQPLQLLPTMANKPPATNMTVIDSNLSANQPNQPPTQTPSEVKLFKNSTAPKVRIPRPKAKRLIRQERVNKNIYEKSPKVELARGAQIGQGTLETTISTRKQFNLLCQYLQDGPPVHALKLRCDFKELAKEYYVVPGELLERLLHAAPCVSSFAFYNCELGEEDFNSVIRYLGQPDCTLEALLFNGDIVSNEVAQSFAAGLKKNGSLKTLSMQSVYMMREAWDYILGALSFRRNLTTLVLDTTARSNVSVGLMADVIKSNSQLCELSISCAQRVSMNQDLNQLTADWDQDFSEFCDQIENNNSLLVLDLSNCSLNSANIDKLADALGRNSSIVEVLLGDNEPSKAQADKINDGLCHTQIRHHIMGDPAAAAAFDMLLPA
jgi:hypothetical protein